MVAVLSMGKQKREADGTPPEDRRTLRVPKDIGKMIKRSAALNDRRVRDYAEPIINAFIDRVIKKSGHVEDVPYPATKIDDKDVTTLNVSPRLADRATRTARVNQTGVQHLLNDATLRDAVTAEYLEALRAALAEMNLQAVPIGQKAKAQQPPHRRPG
jgi:hypothetical protein